MNESSTVELFAVLLFLCGWKLKRNLSISQPSSSVAFLVEHLKKYSSSNMAPIQMDEIGRTFCKQHRREVCHECCMSFDIQNRMAEENAGLIKKKTELEVAAARKALVVSALEGMELMIPRPSPEVFETNRGYLREAEEKLKKFAAQGKDVDTPYREALEAERAKRMETDALVQAWSKENPGATEFNFGGPESQKLYEKVAATPTISSNRAEVYTCYYCKDTSTEKLSMCGRCKKVSYCSKECQRAAWQAHKTLCVPWKGAKEPKSLYLTWDEVEAHDGAPVIGKTLEFRAMLDESVTRQVFSCKDRAGKVRRVAAYTNSRNIPSMQQGSIVRWKNPRFHWFMDGSSGARIEEEDLEDVTVI
jgi:hypothetical protein